MNISLNTKDTNFSLMNAENYNKNLDIDIKSINEKYILLVSDYLKFIIENIKVKNKILARFIITRGLDTITNVFLHLLYYTKNIDMTYFHCQKSFYFYVEFVGQITEEEKMFLQLTSRDATTYVYKETIFKINNEFKKLSQNSVTSKNIFISLVDKSHLQFDPSFIGAALACLMSGISSLNTSFNKSFNRITLTNLF